MPNTSMPEWDALLSSVAHLREILPEAVLVGGTAAAIYACHRVSIDHDHTLTDLRSRFDEVLAQLESVAGWKTPLVTAADRQDGMAFERMFDEVVTEDFLDSVWSEMPEEWTDPGEVVLPLAMVKECLLGGARA